LRGKRKKKKEKRKKKKKRIFRGKISLVGEK
jgi:hypothetical protein